MKKDKIVLKGKLMSICECGKCNVPSYPGRLYIYEWSCKDQRYIKNDDALLPRVAEILYDSYVKNFKRPTPSAWMDVQPDYDQPLSKEEFLKLAKTNPELFKRI